MAGSRFRRRLLGFVAVACVLRVAAGAAVLPRGFAARYFANDSFTPPHERSLAYRGGDITRIDERLAFGRPGEPDLPLYFFNDLTRFNFYQPGEPDRATLPFSVVWEGWVWVEKGAPARQFYLEGAGVMASLEVDGAAGPRLGVDRRSAEAAVSWPRGWRRVTVNLSAPSGAARRFEAGTIVDGARRPLGAGRGLQPGALVLRTPLDWWRLRVDSAVRVVATALDAVLGFALLALGVDVWRGVRHRRGRLLLLGWIAACVEAIWFALPAANRVLLQPGGDDSLTYETQARDILLNGPLMLLGRPAGQAEPFYYQPLYGYAIAATHAVFGEDFFGLFFIQRLLLFVTLLCLWQITERLFGERTGLAAAVVSFVFLYVVMNPWARTLWNETFFVPLAAVWTLGLVLMSQPAIVPPFAEKERTGMRMPFPVAPVGERANVRGSNAAGGLAVLTGIAGGLAVLARSTLLLALVFVVPALALARRHRGWRLAPVAVMLAGMALVVSLATVRNLVAAGRLVAITTSLPINLLLGNPPPAGVPLHDADAHTLYAWIASDDRTRAVVEFARHAPATFAALLGRKAMYALGVFEPLVPGQGSSPVLIGTWLLAALGAALALRKPPRAARALPLAVAAGMCAAVVLIFPTHMRLILPMYVMLLPYAAVTVAVAARRVPLWRA